MLKLYEYTDQYLQAMNELHDLDLPDDVVTDTLNSLKGDLEIKSKNIASYIQNMDASAGMLKKHEQEIKIKRLAMEKRNDWLKNYLLQNMQATGITEIACDYFTIKQRKNPPAVWIVNEAIIPDKYKTEITVTKIDKKAISEDLKNDLSVDGAELHQGVRLSIK